MILVRGKHYPGAQYIGRGSPLGNPFVMKNSSPAERDRVCNAYEVWFEENKETEKVAKELKRLYKLSQKGDLILGCFCYPKRCHGDTIKKFLEQYNAE